MASPDCVNTDMESRGQDLCNARPGRRTPDLYLRVPGDTSGRDTVTGRSDKNIMNSLTRLVSYYEERESLADSCKTRSLKSIG